MGNVFGLGLSVRILPAAVPFPCHCQRETRGLRLRTALRRLVHCGRRPPLLRQGEDLQAG